MSSADIAVIIPARNAAATLAAALDSLLAQSFREWSAVVVEDSSDDDTAAIAERYAARDARISLLRGRFGSAGGARNAGVAATESEWIYFLDSDDVIDAVALERLFETVRSRPDAGAAHCGWRYVNAAGEIIGEARCPFEGDLFAHAAQRSLFAIHACLVRRRHVVGAGLFDVSLKTNEDVDLWRRVARLDCDFIALPEILVDYRLRSDLSWFDTRRFMADALASLAAVHGPDPRLSAPNIRHPDGAPKAWFGPSAYFVALYAAGLAAALGEDAGHPLDAAAAGLDRAGSRRETGIDPGFAAEAIFNAVPFALVRPVDAWPELWAQVSDALRDVLRRLEQLTGTSGVAWAAYRALERRVAGRLAGEGRIGATLVARVRADAPLQPIVGDGVETAMVRVSYAGVELGEVVLPVCDGVLPPVVLADAIAAAFAWPMLGRYFALQLYPSLTVEEAANGAAVLRDGLLLGTAPVGTTPSDAAMHDAVGWTALLQEAWGVPDWSNAKFYEPVPEPATGAVGAGCAIEVGAEQPPIDIPGDAALVEVRVGGVRAGWFRAAGGVDPLTPDQAIQGATQALGWELFTIVAREALVGRACDALSLADRLADARRLDRTAAEPREARIGRWPGQQDVDVLLGRGTLPTKVAKAIDTSIAAEARQVLFLPEIGPAPRWLAEDGAQAEQADRSGLVRHHFESLFAAKANPWSYTSPYEQAKYEQTLSQIPFRPGVRVLELACAEGHFTARLAPRVGQLTATDISETALGRASERCAGLGNVRFQRLDLAYDALPGVFDVIVCSEVLYYLEDHAMLAAVAANLAAALAPGGCIVLAHANTVVDAPEETGFDWGVPFGARTIGQVFAAAEDLVFDQELSTTLYRIQRFRRRGLFDVLQRRSESPRRRVTAEFVMPEPDVARHVLWDGGAARPASAVAGSTSRLPILTYHRVAPDGPAELARYRVDPGMFEAQLQYLKEVGVRSASLDEWRHARRTRTPLIGSRVLLTFDDGYADFAEHAWPLLKRYGFGALVFLPTGHVGDAARWDARFGEPAPLMGWEEIRALAGDGVMFGSHSVSHPMLPGLDNAGVCDELLRARLELERQLQTPVSALAYPYGLFTPEIARLAEACGYADAVRTDGGFSEMSDPPLALRRIDVDGRCSLTEFVALFNGA